MARPKTVIVLLAALLAASNLWWAFRMLDAGISRTYMSVSLEDNQQALAQTLSLLPVAAKSGATREELLMAAKLPSDSSEPFEKEGFVWVGKIGLRFDAQDRLVAVSRAWDPP